MLVMASWDSHTIAAYKFENSSADDTGNGYNLTALGTGGVYQTDNVKYGTTYA